MKKCDGSPVMSDHQWLTLDEPRLHLTHNKETGQAEVVRVVAECVECGIEKVDERIDKEEA